MVDEQGMSVFDGDSSRSRPVVLYNGQDRQIEKVIDEVLSLCGADLAMGQLMHQALRELTLSEARTYVGTLRELAGMYRRELEEGDPDVAELFRRHYLVSVPELMVGKLRRVTDQIFDQMLAQVARIHEPAPQLKQHRRFLGIFGE